MSADRLLPDQHFLCIEFSPNGHAQFFPCTNDPQALAERFAQLLRILVEHPSAVRCAAGYHREVERES